MMIYETRGRAREYFELAANLYSGCEHGCVYCYGPDVMHKKPFDFHSKGAPRRELNDILHTLRNDALHYQRSFETRHILLSFVTDPYQPAEMRFKLTRRAIEILHECELDVAILTKGGLRATRDFDLLTCRDIFGTTLTFRNPMRSKAWEPLAAPPLERIKSLKEAKNRGIQTFVSCEPVIDTAETLQLIEETADFVDVFKVGPLNYLQKLPREFKVQKVDWKNFARNVIILLDRLGANYYIKRDLAKYIGKPEGISVGKLPK